MTYALMDVATGALAPTGLALAPDPMPAGKELVVEARPPFTWDATKRAWVSPRLFTFNEWVDLFPLAEQLAIVTATMTDPLARLIYDRAMAASGSIDPSDPRTVEGLGYLVAMGWVSQATFDGITGA